MESVLNIMERIGSIKDKMNRYFSSDLKKPDKNSAVDGQFAIKESLESKKKDPLKQKFSFDRYIDEASKKHKVPRELIGAIIERESDFNPRAVSKKGAMGLMQLMPQTVKEMGLSDPFKPRDNILGGTGYFKQMLARYEGDIVRALAAYNAGPSNLKNDKVPDFLETKNYIKNVLDSYLKNTGVIK